MNERTNEQGYSLSDFLALFRFSFGFMENGYTGDEN
jgi:hypothetical protein